MCKKLFLKIRVNTWVWRSSSELGAALATWTHVLPCVSFLSTREMLLSHLAHILREAKLSK